MLELAPPIVRRLEALFRAEHPSGTSPTTLMSALKPLAPHLHERYGLLCATNRDGSCGYVNDEMQSRDSLMRSTVDVLPFAFMMDAAQLAMAGKSGIHLVRFVVMWLLIIATQSSIQRLCQVVMW